MVYFILPHHFTGTGISFFFCSFFHSLFLEKIYTLQHIIRVRISGDKKIVLGVYFSAAAYQVYVDMGTVYIHLRTRDRQLNRG